MVNKGDGPNNGVVHHHAFDYRAAVTNNAFRSNETPGLNFGVTAHNGVGSYDGRAADYSLSTYDCPCVDVNRANYNGPIFNVAMNVL